MNSIEKLREFLKEPASFWINLLRDILAKTKVVIRGIPSIELQEKQAAEEKARIEAQVKSLGKEGLEAKAKKLQAAMDENEKEAPDSIFDAFPIPGIKSINFHTVSSVNSESSKPSLRGVDLTRFKAFAQLTDAKTNFAYIKTFLDTSDVPEVS